MKKRLLFVCSILLVLASCASNKAVKTEVEPEPVETTVVEQIEVPVLVEEDLSPASAEVASDQPAEEPQVLPEEEVEQPISESVLEEIEQEFTEMEPVQTLPESDWGYVFTSSEQPVSQEAEEEKPVVEETASQVKEEKPSAPVSIPSQAAPVQPKSEPSVFDRILLFISNEILFSVGLLVCFIGLVYFIIALVRSGSRPSRRRKPNRDDKVSEPSETVDANASDDSDLSDEDDEFLKALLGEDRK